MYKLVSHFRPFLKGLLHIRTSKAVSDSFLKTVPVKRNFPSALPPLRRSVSFTDTH